MNQHARPLRWLLPVLLLLLAPVLVASAQPGAAVPAQAATIKTALAAPAQAAALAQTPPDQRLYLPLLAISPVVTIEFAASANQDTGELIDPNTNFASGLDLLYVSARIDGAEDRKFRLDFVFASGQLLEGDEQTVFTNSYRYTTAYCISTARTCSTGRRPLPAGTYIARIYLDGVLYKEAQAFIQ